MFPTTKATRTQVTRRLKEAGFQSPCAARIAGLTDAMLEGLTPVAYALVAATETCGACGLARTQRRLADALVCLAVEVSRETGIPLRPAARSGAQNPPSLPADHSTRPLAG